MLKRTSRVRNIDLTILSFASIFEVGDSDHISAFTRVLAVQRQYQLFFGDEGDFDLFPIFKEVIPRPVINENIVMNRTNMNNDIYVNNINILGVSTSAILHIGSTNSIQNESRVLHIRQAAEQNKGTQSYSIT